MLSVVPTLKQEPVNEVMEARELEEWITAVRMMILKDGPSNRDVNRFKNKSRGERLKDAGSHQMQSCRDTVQLQNGACLHS